MTRFLLAVLVGCGLSGPAAAQPKTDDAVARVLADWKARQGKMKVARYVLAGTVEHVAKLTPDAPPLPATDRARPFRATLLLDLERGRVRFDKEEEWPDAKGGWERSYGSFTHDGKETRSGRTPGRPHDGPGFDLAIDRYARSGREGSRVYDYYWPVLFAHGVVPTVHAPLYAERLPTAFDPEDFVSVGRRPLGATTYQVIRTEPLAAASPLLDEYWVDTAKQGAIRRYVSLTGEQPWLRLDIDWRETPAGWWPAKWTHTLTVDGRTVNRVAKLAVESYEYDPPVPDADFTLPVEPGMREVIVAEATPEGAQFHPAYPARRTYRITETGEWVETAAERARTLDGREVPLERRWGWWPWAAGAAGAISIGLAARVWHRRRSPG
ncbi:MAG: hypothetical protein K2X87_30165, partial [Gemmataceae bacterium]|nr:hypothetical protein [Gemmataceae bacterium]